MFCRPDRWPRCLVERQGVEKRQRLGSADTTAGRPLGEKHRGWTQERPRLGPDLSSRCVCQSRSRSRRPVPGSDGVGLRGSRLRMAPHGRHHRRRRRGCGGRCGEPASGGRWGRRSPGAWRAWSRGGTAELRGLGAAFASKVAYFACYDRAGGTGPLIADQNTAWALWALAGIWDSRARQTTYGRYIETAGRWAGELGCRSDDIERALFTMGPHIRGTWQRLNR
jgi:hypothetical protein